MEGKEEEGKKNFRLLIVGKNRGREKEGKYLSTLFV